MSINNDDHFSFEFEPLSKENIKKICGEVSVFTADVIGFQHKATGERAEFVSKKKLAKIIEQLEDEQELAYADFTEYAEEHGLDEEYDSFFHMGLKRAIEILREVCK